MLAVNNYDQDYIDKCRGRIEELLVAYSALITAAGHDQSDRSAVEAFEPLFFNNLTLILDAYFVHRTRAIEGKDGNPLNEVRMLGTSILHHDGVLSADKTIKYKPETAVLKLALGDVVQLDESQFRLLSDAYFAEIEHRFA